MKVKKILTLNNAQIMDHFVLKNNLHAMKSNISEIHGSSKIITFHEIRALFQKTRYKN